MKTLPRTLPLATLLLTMTIGPARAEPAKLWSEAKQKPLVAIPSAAPLVDKVGGAVLVLFVDAELDVRALPPGHPPIGGPDAPFPFPMPEGGDAPEVRGQGAGFLISPDGYAITNEHVVENAVSVRALVGSSHDELPVTVIGVDEKTDVALIKLDSPRKDWPVVPFGDSDALKPGDFVVAIGSPFGLQQSVSLGIVSARGRRDIAPSGRQGLYDFLQTDASINPGNSGGPLLNLSGEVIGMNAAVNAAGAGIGFAIPINQIKRLLPSLREKGRFERSWIGVSIQAVLPEHAKGLGLDRARGALVREVVGDGPAAKAGLLPGDIVTAFESKLIEDSYELPLLAGDAGVGKQVKLDVLRDGQKLALQVTLGAHPDNTGAPLVKPPEPEKERDGSIGITVVTLDNADRNRLKLNADVTGTRVKKVRPGSPAYLAGIAADDVIVTVNKKPTRTANDFAAAINDAKPGELLKLLVRRGDSQLFFPLVKPAKSGKAAEQEGKTP